MILVAWNSCDISDDGNTIVVGSTRGNYATTSAFIGDGIGKVRVYQYSSNNWNQIGQTLTDVENGPNFGHQAYISGMKTNLVEVQLRRNITYII